MKHSPKNQRPIIAITGANGFVGRALVEHFAAHGWQVHALVRSPELFPAIPHVRAFAYTLDAGPSDESLAGATVLVHTAYIKTHGAFAGAQDPNVLGAKQLLAAARRVGSLKQLVFMSSMSAFEGTTQAYGQQKLAIEKLFAGAGGVSLRSGLVLGAGGGLAARIVAFMRRWHVAPIIGGGDQPLQVIALSDLVQIIDRAVDLQATGTLLVGTPEVYSYREFYLALRDALGLRVAIVPVPFWLPLAVIRTVRWLHLPLGVTEDNLLGLKKLHSFETLPILATLGVQTQNLNAILSDPTLQASWKGSATRPRPPRSAARIISQHKLARYLVSGVTSEVIEFASFVALLAATHLLVLSNSISFILGIASGFVLHKFWSFGGQQRLRTRRQIIGYTLLAGFNFAVTNVLISLLVHQAHVRPALSKLIVMALTASWSFVAFNFVIFRHHAAPNGKQTRA